MDHMWAPTTGLKINLPLDTDLRSVLYSSDGYSWVLEEG